MTQTEALKLALRSIRELIVDESDDAPALQGVRMRKLAAEKAIKEALAQPEQEPVAWAFLNGQYAHIVWGKQRPDDEIHTIPLYTSPPAHRKPLTDEQIGQILDDPNIAEAHQGHWRVLPFAYARAIEAAHGIKGDA